MGSTAEIGWETCSEHGCIGVRSGERLKCLAHLGGDELDVALQESAANGRLAQRGISMGSELLHRILNPFPAAADGCRNLPEAEFSQTTFEAGVNFARAIFEGSADFSLAKFGEDAVFNDAIFKAEAQFF